MQSYGSMFCLFSMTQDEQFRDSATLKTTVQTKTWGYFFFPEELKDMTEKNKANFMNQTKQTLLQVLFSSSIITSIQTQNGCYKKKFSLQEMSIYKNITNGEISLNFDPQDKASEEFKLTKVMGYDSLEFLKREDPNIPISYYIQNIRSGTFSEISQTYMKESAKQKTEEQSYTVDSFQTEMQVLFAQFQNKLFKITTFFQGLFAGMALLYAITLNLSVSISVDLIRFEDQCMRVLSLLSALGALYSVLISKQKYDIGKTRATSAEVDQLYKSSILCVIELIFYLISYVIYNISHKSAIFYNIEGTSYSELKSSTTAFTIITLIGWIITNTNTYKYENRN